MGRIADEIAAALPDAKVTAMQEAVKSREHAVDQFRQFSYAIVGVVIAIEALVVFLTVMGSVSERTHEIGVFRAIGFRRVHITRLILIEAVDRQRHRRRARLPGRHGRHLRRAAAGGAAAPRWRGRRCWASAAVALAVAIGGLASLYPALHAGKIDPDRGAARPLRRGADDREE